MISITSTRHAFGSADVFVDADEVITAPSYSTGTLTTVVPLSYWLDDEVEVDDRVIEVLVTGRNVKKDGTPAARTTRVALYPSEVPADVRAALALMRPDLAARLA